MNTQENKIEKKFETDSSEEDEDWSERYTTLLLDYKLLQDEFSLYKQQNPAKKPKVKPPPAPPQYWTTREVARKDGTTSVGFTEQDWLGWKAQLGTKDKLLYICDKGWTSTSTFKTCVGVPILLKKVGKGQDTKTKLERSRKASQECKIPDHKRCQHNKMVEGSSGKEFTRCSRTATWTLLGRKCCKSHSNQIVGLAQNEKRAPSDIKAKHQQHLIGKKGYWVEYEDLKEYGSPLSGGWYNSNKTPEQKAQQFKELTLARKTCDLCDYNQEGTEIDSEEIQEIIPEEI